MFMKFCQLIGTEDIAMNETKTCLHEACRVSCHHHPLAHTKARITSGSYHSLDIHIQVIPKSAPMSISLCNCGYHRRSVYFSLTTLGQTPASLPWFPTLAFCSGFLFAAVPDYQKLGGSKQHKFVILLFGSSEV